MPVTIQNVFYTYNPKSPVSFQALRGINCEIEEGSFTAIVGRTGCGKSTLIQHINALLNPSEGVVIVDDFKNTPDKKSRSKNTKDLRKKVGLVFQFPEYQLFEETVEKDVAYGPKNFGMSKEEALKAAHDALAKVGLGPSFYERSPFDLSGGEKRRVAIAGILAYRPDYLILDEPTAGLDPRGAEEMMALFTEIHKAGTTIILVTHDMNLVLEYCDHVLLLANGLIEKSTTPEALFQEDLESYSLETPMIYRFIKGLNEKGVSLHETSSLEDLAKQIAERRKK